MDDITKIITTFFGTIVIVAIVATIVGKKSQAPAAIQAIGSSLSSVVAAAVNPVSANYGYGNGGSTFSSPSNNSFSELTTAFSNVAAIPGVFK